MCNYTYNYIISKPIQQWETCMRKVQAQMKVLLNSHILFSIQNQKSFHLFYFELFFIHVL